MPQERTVATPVEHHIERFQNWLSLRPTSKEKYTERIRSFYSQSLRDTPLDPEQFTDIDETRLTDDLIEFISCETDQYALKKYFDWLQQRSPDVQNERTILFFKNKIDHAELNPDERDIGEKVLSVDKVRELCQQTPRQMRTDQDQTRVLLQMMYDTATRISGMLWLEWRDIWREEYEGKPLGSQELLIHKERSKSKESGIVELSDDTLQRLKQHEERITPTDSHQRVFYNHLQPSSAYQKVYRNFKDVAENIGVPEASPHWFRHSRLTHLGMKMREEGKSYPDIKERLRKYGRHQDATTTEIYIKILKNRKTESISQYSAISWGE